MEIKGEYIVVGAMSGTSLDGLDIAICKFNIFNNNVSYEIVGAETIDYNEQWQKILQNAFMFSGYDLYKTDLLYGKFIGEEVLKLVNKYKITPLLIASHGHTIFHQPSEQLTLQIGSGAAISSVTGIPVVSDFRISDVLLGGQGAPLVPMGEKILFKGINSFLNIGGFANISFHNNDSKVIAWDVCPANIILNYLAQREQLEYDIDGKIASTGEIITDLLYELNNLKYYLSLPPKSLAREWLEIEMLPVIKKYYHYPTKDLLRTLVEHIAIQVFVNFKKSIKNKIFITGGGALNSFLIKRLKYYMGDAIYIPDRLIIKYKEAVIFAYLGLLRWFNYPNVLSSVTGATRDSCGGAVYNSKSLE